MREFSNYEKMVLDELCQIEPADLITISRFITDRLYTLESGMVLAFLPGTNAAILYLKGRKEECHNRKKVAQFLELISLFEYLQKNRYIHDTRFSSDSSLSMVGGIAGNITRDNANNNLILNADGDYIVPGDPAWIFNIKGEKEYEGLVFRRDETTIFDTVSSMIASPLAPTQELKEFVRNNYQTTEDLRYRRSMCYTKTALVVAITFGIISTGIGLLSLLPTCD